MGDRRDAGSGVGSGVAGRRWAAIGDEALLCFEDIHPISLLRETRFVLVPSQHGAVFGESNIRVMSDG